MPGVNVAVDEGTISTDIAPGMCFVVTLEYVASG